MTSVRRLSFDPHPLPIEGVVQLHSPISYRGKSGMGMAFDRMTFTFGVCPQMHDVMPEIISVHALARNEVEGYFWLDYPHVMFSLDASVEVSLLDLREPARRTGDIVHHEHVMRQARGLIIPPGVGFSLAYVGKELGSVKVLHYGQQEIHSEKVACICAREPAIRPRALQKPGARAVSIPTVGILDIAPELAVAVHHHPFPVARD